MGNAANEVLCGAGAFVPLKAVLRPVGSVFCRLMREHICAAAFACRAGLLCRRSIRRGGKVVACVLVVNRACLQAVEARRPY